MMPIVHDLIKNFKLIQLDFILKEENKTAIKYSKLATDLVGYTEENPDLFKITFDTERMIGYQQQIEKP